MSSRMRAEAIESRAAQAEEAFHGRVEVRLCDQGGFLTIVVTDNGIGLPADYERLVEPYVTTREKGTGLGLAIVSKIVEEHGGDIAFKQERGRWLFGCASLRQAPRRHRAASSGIIIVEKCLSGIGYIDRR